MPANSSRHQQPSNPPPASQHPAYNAMPAGFQNLQNFYPNTATQADLQHILRLVNELSELNASNRKETTLLIEGVQQMAAKHKQSESALGIETSQDTDRLLSSSNSVEPSDHILLQNKHADLVRHYEQQSRIMVRYADILNDYEDTMSSMMVRVREFAHAHTATLLQWHKYYNSLLQKERDEKHQLFCDNAKNEEILAAARSKLSEIKHHMLDCELPWMRQVAYLKAENKFLKQKLGAPYNDDDEDSDNDQRLEQTQYLASQNSADDANSDQADSRGFDAVSIS